jgi:hypothetical protein
VTSTPQEIADSIRDIPIDWDDANELDEILKSLHAPIEAMKEKLQRLSDSLEVTAIIDSYKDAISGASGSLTGVSQQLADVIRGGVLRR